MMPIKNEAANVIFSPVSPTRWKSHWCKAGWGVVFVRCQRQQVTLWSWLRTPDYLSCRYACEGRFMVIEDPDCLDDAKALLKLDGSESLPETWRHIMEGLILRYQRFT